jgi:hypothetical protein
MITTRGRITIINSTGIIILTRDLFSYTTNIGLTTFVVTAIREASDKVISTSNDRITIVSMAEVSSLTLSRGIRKDATFYFIAGVISTSVRIITFNLTVFASVDWAARILCTFIVVIAIYTVIFA